MKIILKAIFSLLLLSIWKYAGIYTSAMGSAEAGAVAVKQFDDGIANYATTITQMEFFKSMSGGFSTSIIFLIIIGLWWSEIMALFKSKDKLLTVLGLILAGNVIIPNDAFAYYSKQDWAENVNVLPNHSAFLIPATGDTKDSQKQFESEAFLNDKKVGAKRIQIPHVVMKNSGIVDYYVPGAILVLLDRTPYVVNWTKTSTPESPTNQEVCVESADSIQVCFDVSIGANVLEEDAAKYLYWFGVEPSTDGNADERNFPSVLNGKSLQNVMNTRVHSRIKSAYFTEFAKHPFKEMLAKKSEILKDVEAQMIAEYKKMGITIEYIGISSDLRLDPKLQQSINDLVISQYAKEAAAFRLEALKTDRYEAETTVLLAQAEPYKRWDGKLPSLPQWMISSDKISDWIGQLTGVFKK